MIEIKNVSQAYGKKQVLFDINLKIQDQMITGLIGPNGAGKSTLLSVISRLLEPLQGSVTLDGLDVRNIKSKELAKRIAVLRQNNNINLKLTVEELVEFGRFPHSNGRLTKEDKIKVDEAIKYLKLDNIRDEYIDELSGGQKQRAYIAMVLAQDTKYIFLDEPLNNLDMRHAVEMMTTLENLVKDFNKTIVIVMHDINIAAAFCDHIVAMKDGKIITEGNTNEVIEKDILDNVFDHNFCIAGIGGKKVCVYHDILGDAKITINGEEVRWKN